MDRKKQPQAVFEYDVFLSFRGTDTRENFTDVLYHKMEEYSLRVFRDNDKLQPGQKIDEILLAVESSRICMPILSPSFASSKWCLREVAKMVELKKEIVPVFFGVTPDDVKLPPNSVYKDDLEKLKEEEDGEDKDEVKSWEEALKQVARIKGFEWRKEGYIEFIDKLVDDLQKKLMPNRQLVADYLVGIDDEINEAKKLLDTKSSDVRFLGIHGMGGSGKTTVAKNLFNELLSTSSPSFQCCSFLADVRETSNCPGRIEHLQERLLRSLSREDTTRIANPMQMIRKNFRKKKVLIVLDDVDQKDQIEKLVGEGEYFGPGSRIIVTARDSTVLGICHESVIVMEGLKAEEALELFSWHAFKGSSPTQEEEDLAKKAVKVCGVLPLPLEVIGSFLNGKEKSIWAETTEKLQKVPHQKVIEKLRISYDALEYEQQQMFLDIALFFNKKEKSYPIYMWEASDFCPKTGLNALISLLLVKVEEDDKLRMHDHLVALGKDIVHGEALQYPFKCSRYWDHEGGSLHVLKSKEGKGKIVGLQLHGPYPNAKGDDLVGLDNVRFLSLEEAKFGEMFDHYLPELRWLSWHHLPSSLKTANLNIQNLAILELQHSSISENWSGWSDIRMMHLKVLDLTDCSGLTTTPDFSRMPNLERLILSQCANLVELHSSIVSLKNLRFIDLSYCSSLSKLPEGFGCLGKLEQVSLHDCTSLQKLPDSLGNLKSLLELDISRKLIPVFRIYQLIDLRVAGEVASWDEDMDLSIMTNFFEQHFLMQMVRVVKFLKDMILTKMTFFREASLPNTFEGLKALTKLDLSCTHIKHLPESFGNLQNLRDLTARWSFLVALPKSIGKMKKLETIDVGLGLNLAEIPEEIGELSNLTVLNLMRTKISRLPSTITQLRLLRSLNLTGCSNLKEARKAKIRLKKQRASASSSKNQHSGASSSKNQHAGAAGSLKNQPASAAGSSKNRRAIAGSLKKAWPLRRGIASSLKKAGPLRRGIAKKAGPLRRGIAKKAGPLRRGIASSLKKAWPLRRSIASSLKKAGLLRRGIPKKAGPLRRGIASSLKKAWPLRRGRKGTTLPSSFDDCSRLEVLELCCLHLSNIPQLPSGLRRLALDQFHHKLKLPNISNLQNLTYLSVCCVIRGSTCDNLECLPASLKELRVLHCNSLPDLSHLENLQKLVVLGRDSLKQIRGLAKLGSLQELRISHCKSLQSLESLEELGKLKYLSIRKCPSLGGLKGLDTLSLVEQDVHLRGCNCTDCSIEEGGFSVKREFIYWISEMGISRSDLPVKVQQFLNTPDKASTGCLAIQVKKFSRNAWSINLRNQNQIERYMLADSSMQHSR